MDDDEDDFHVHEVCHFFIKEGNIIYCGDCTHEFKGKTLELSEIS